MPKLTNAVIESATLPPGKPQDFIRDDALTGFGLKIGKTSKTYIVEAKVNGKSRRKVIGNADLMNVTTARKKAKALLAQFSEGVDPSAKKKVHDANKITLAEAYEFKKERSKKVKPSTWAMYQETIDRRMADWKDKPLSEITPNVWIDRFLEIDKSVGLASALATKRVLSSIWNKVRLNLTDDDG